MDPLRAVKVPKRDFMVPVRLVRTEKWAEGPTLKTFVQFDKCAAARRTCL